MTMTVPPLLRHVRTGTWIRWAGLAAIVALLPYEGSPLESGWLGANAAVLVGVFPLVVFLWLAATGVFGYGSPRRADWPSLLIFLLAFVIREGIARHANGENEMYFYYGGFRHRHSVVHPLLQMFLQPLARDPYAWMMHVNGTLGALATLPLYLFLRQRTKCGTTAALGAVFFAVHPIVVEMAPTDLPYSLMLLAWFSGLALLTADDVGARQIFGGAALLGIAATCRAEGVLYLVTALLLVDVRALVSALRSHRSATALGTGALLVLLAVHVYFCIPLHIEPGSTLPNLDPFTFWDVLRAGLFSYAYNEPLFVALVVVGALAGLRDERLRVGLGACVATLVVVWPFSVSTDPTLFLWRHRLVPVCALQAIAAGVGASWLVRTLAFGSRWHWLGVVPVLGVALLMFLGHLREIHSPNALTDEFWMLRKQLAPGGEVRSGCTLMALGGQNDTDLTDFAEVLPGMSLVRCEQDDCVRAASRGGCLYYLRSLRCFFRERWTPLPCVERGRTAAGDVFSCMDPRCVRIEQELELSLVEERNVDVHAAFPDPRFPRTADIGLYRVVDAKP